MLNIHTHIFGLGLLLVRYIGDPFLYIIMEDEQQQPPQDPAPHAAAAAPSIKLPPFWASNPEAWFGMEEGQFILRGVTD